MVSNGNRISEHFSAESQTTTPASGPTDYSKVGEQWLQAAQTFVSQRPVACLAGAFATGVVIAWFLKRTR